MTWSPKLLTHTILLLLFLVLTRCPTRILRLNDSVFDDKPELVTTENGQQEKTDDPEEVGVQPPVENVTHVKDDQQHNTVEEVVNEEALKQVNDEGVAATLKNSKEAVEGEPLKQSEEIQPPSTDISQLEVASSEVKSMTRKMEVPNNKIGVLIGKAGDTIRYLQLNSGTRIQITRDVDADPYAGTRPVELIGTLESIIKAEKLIKDVIAEADAGGSPSLMARGFNTVQAAESGEQVQIQVPNDKVGVIIGKGGETIKNLQTRSGARIQLIPQHLPEGDQSQERTVRVTGDKKQIEMAREMIKEVTIQIWLFALDMGGQCCSPGVAIYNLYSLSSTEERYHALKLAIAGC